MGLSIDAVIAAVNAGTPEQKRALREALKVGQTAEQAAASQAYVQRTFACTVNPSCGRTGFRTAGRASIHGVDAGGHTPATT